MHSRASLRRALAAFAAFAAMACVATPALADTVAAPDSPTAGGVCLMAKADVESSAWYLALPAVRRAAIDRYAGDLCARADAIVASLTPAQKADLLAQLTAPSPAPCRRTG